MMKNTKKTRAGASVTPSENLPLDGDTLKRFVRKFLDRRELYLRAAERCGSPLYLIEKPILTARAKQFTEAFRAVLPDIRVYFAVKSNNHPAVARTLVKAGLGLDVSSGRELRMALDSGAEDIVFSGPGKTGEELFLAVEHRDRVTVLIDSLGELEHLESIAGETGAAVRAGVRLTTDERALWAKFGIPLSSLPAFLAAAGQTGHVRLRGFQFHTSWNMTPDNQVSFIIRLAGAIGSLDDESRKKIEFIDIGGGFWPEDGEWLHREDGGVVNPDNRDRDPLLHFRKPSVPIREFAEKIGRAFREKILPLTGCRLCAEPGRWLCHPAMQILLRVTDRKGPDLVITDAGTNAIGWERFETDYFPVINLSRPGLTEHPCRVLGSLCTPHDVWGYSYHGEDIRPGDLLLLPNQGAYTYSLRQEFIKPLPGVATVDAAGEIASS
ncbi:MAG: alanine racemase [PVC group bacterium]